MTPEGKLDELEALAKAATPGPYRAGNVERFHVFTPHGATMGLERVLLRTNEHFENHGADATYLAALDPVTVLSLVAETRAYRALKAEWERPATTESDWLEFCQDFDWEVTT